MPSLMVFSLIYDPDSVITLTILAARSGRGGSRCGVFSGLRPVLASDGMGSGDQRGGGIRKEWLSRGLGQWGGGALLVDYKGL